MTSHGESLSDTNRPKIGYIVAIDSAGHQVSMSHMNCSGMGHQVLISWISHGALMSDPNRPRMGHNVPVNSDGHYVFTPDMNLSLHTAAHTNQPDIYHNKHNP